MTAWSEGVLDSHAAERARDGGARVRVDHAVIGAGAAELVIAMAERAGLARHALEFALVDGDRRGVSIGLERADAVTALQERALALGFEFLRPGGGWIARAHLERAGAPGKLVAVTGARPSLAGAVGGLAFECDALEMAGVIARGELELPPLVVKLVWLTGRLPWDADGADLGFAIRERAAAMSADVLEFAGPGAESLGPADRVRVIQALEGSGPASVVFPPDAAARAALRAFGRDADWRPAVAADRPPGALHVELDAIEPRAAFRAGRARDARARVARAGGRARRDRAARRDRGRGVAARRPRRRAGARARRGAVAAGEPRPLTGARASSVGSERLASAGVQAVEPGAAEASREPGEGLELAWGFPAGARLESLVASPSTCAAAARAGVLAPVREGTRESEPQAAELTRVAEGWVLGAGAAEPRA